MTNEYELEARSQGYKVICGVDEAGRGPIAGPVCAAAVILDPDNIPEGLNDSKKLSEKKREELYGAIVESCLCYGVSLVDEKTIDEINILQATFLAMRQAVDSLSIKPELVFIDGNQSPRLSVPERTVIKGDAKVLSIAAASILAKVTRDRYMYELDRQYPEYQFAKHKGYGTKLHYEMIAQYGASPVHRVSFLKKLH